MYEEPSPYSSQVPTTEMNIWAIISLVSGILGWLGVFGLGGIVEVLTGHVAKSQIRNSGGHMTGDGLATAGLVLGYLNLAFTLLALCLGILAITGVISGAVICPFIFGNPQ